MGISAALMCRLASTSLARPVLRATTGCSAVKCTQPPLAQTRSAMADAAYEDSDVQDINPSSSLRAVDNVVVDRVETIEPPPTKNTHDWDAELGVDLPSSRMEPAPRPEPQPMVVPATPLDVASKRNFVYALLGEPWASSRMTDAQGRNLDSSASSNDDPATKNIGTHARRKLNTNILIRKPLGPPYTTPTNNPKNLSHRRQTPGISKSHGPGYDSRGFDPRLSRASSKSYGNGNGFSVGQTKVSDITAGYDMHRTAAIWTKRKTTKAGMKPISAIQFAAYKCDNSRLDYSEKCADDYNSPRRVVEYSEPIDLPQNSFVYSPARLWGSGRRLQ